MVRNPNPFLRATVLLLALATFASAQEPAPAPDDKPQQKSDSILRTIWRQPFPGRWTVNGELSFQQVYNDNAFPSGPTRLSDLNSRFQGMLSLTAAKKHLTFEAHYVPQYSLSERINDRNSFSQQAYASSTYKFTGRTSLTGDFTLSQSKFNSVQPFQFTVVDQLVVPVFRPEVTQRDSDTVQISSGLELVHHFSSRNSVTARLNGKSVWITQRDSTGKTVVNRRQNYNSEGSLNWTHQVNARRTLGFEVSENYLAYPDRQSHANSQTVKLTFSQTLPRGFSFHASAGPDFRTTSGAAANAGELQVSGAFSVGVSKSIEQGAVGISVSRGTRTGITADTFTSTRATVFATRTFLRRWQAGATFGYNRSSGISGGNEIESYSTQANIGYSFTRRLSAQFSYSYLNQIGARTSIGNQKFDRNVFTFGLKYDIGKLFSE